LAAIDEDNMLEFVYWLVKSLVLLGVLHFIVPTVLHPLTKNSYWKLPVFLFAGIAGGFAMAALDYVPYIIALLWLYFTHHALKYMSDAGFAAKVGYLPNLLLFRVSSYSYVILACAMAVLLQTEICSVADGSVGQCRPLWKAVVGLGGH
jgi:hypothetical protein